MKALHKAKFLGVSTPLIACATLMIGVPLVAQESEAVQATIEESSDEAVDVRGDSGIEVVQEAQIQPQMKYEENKTATEQIEAFASSRNYYQGWDDQKKRLFVIETGSFNTEDPSYDVRFLSKRESAAKQAILKAKGNIIEFINTEMSAQDQLSVPGSDLQAQLGAAYEAAEKRIAKQQREVAKLLEQFNAAEADTLRGATMRDRINSLMDAAIKKLDAEYSSSGIEQKKKEKYEKAKTRYLESVTKIEELEKEAEKLKGEVTSTFSSEVSKHAKMPLFGATVISQAESWNEDDETYEVAVLVCWSAGLEKAARATLTGEQLKVNSKNSKKLSIGEWLNKQNLSVMVGPRQYLDSDGRRHFLGITARPLGKSASHNSKNKKIADLFASQMAAFSLFADVDSYAKAQSIMQTKNSGGLDSADTTTAVESLEQTISQGIAKLNIRGLGKMASKIVNHPISGQKMYVSVWGLSPASAASAMQIERSNMLAAIAVNKSQAFQKGQRKGWQEEVDGSKNDRDSYEAGKNAKLVGHEAEGKDADGSKVAQPGQKKTQEKKAKSGSATGDNDVDDDWRF